MCIYFQIKGVATEILAKIAAHLSEKYSIYTGSCYIMSQNEFGLLKLDRDVSAVLSIMSKDSDSIGIRVLRLFLKVLEYSGHGIPWIASTLYIIYKFPDMDTRLFFCNLMMALLVDLAIVGLTKAIVRRPRPVYNVDDMFATVSVDRYSFPSGHTTRVAMVAMLFTHYWSNKAYIRFGYIWAGMVATSRVVLGRHHVSDVIGGVIIGYIQYHLVLKYWLTWDTLEQIFNIVNFYSNKELM